MPIERLDALLQTRRPYYIVAPNYSRQSAGVRVLYLLCHLLNRSGEEAYIVANISDQHLRAPLLTPDIELQHKQTNARPIAIYPEIIFGNPLGLRSIARFILNHPGLINGPKNYPETELLFFYNQEYAASLPERQPRLLQIPTIDTKLFNNHDNPADNKRSGMLLYPGRHIDAAKQNPELFQKGTVITSYWPSTHAELAKLLRASERLYCFTNSAIAQEAVLCGCPVVFIETPYTADFLKIQRQALTMYRPPGMAIEDTEEELTRARASITNFATIQHNIEACVIEELADFISLTQALPDNDSTNVYTQCDPQAEYNAWIAQRALSEIDTRYYSEHVNRLWKQQPLFEFILVLRRGQETLLADSIDSLSQQYFDGWRLSIFAESPSPEPEFEQEGCTVRWIEVAENTLVKAINAKINRSSATWIGFFECGTQFAQHLLLACGDYSAIHPKWRLIYSDEDAIGAENVREAPKFKPDINPDFLRSSDYIGSFFVAREALMAVGGYSQGAGGERYDITLRILDACGESAIGHIPDVLYHVPHAVSQQASDEAARQSLCEHFARRQIQAEVHAGLVPGYTRRINYLHPTTPKVSIIIANKNRLDLLGPCVESLLSRTRYPDWELLIVDNGSDDSSVSAYYQTLSSALGERIRVLNAPGDFNFSAMNNLAARAARGDYLLLLNNDTEVLNDDWLNVLMSHAQRPEIGVVGARLLTPGAMQVQEAGRVLGMCGTAGPVFAAGQSPEQPGYMLRALADQNYSALSGACLLVRKSLYEEVHGCDEDSFRISNGELDLCLKIQKQGYRAVWTPFATLIHHASAARSAPAESAESANSADAQQRRASRLQHEAHQLTKRWLPQLANDPAWNRHLSLSSTQPVTEGELVVSWNQDFRDRPRLLWMPLASPGQAEYRTFAPLRALHAQGLAQCASICQPKPGQDRAPTPIELARLAPDTLIMHAPVDDVRFIGLLHYKEINSDLLRIYSLDDLITNIPTGSHVHRKLPSALMHERLRLGLAASDRLIVSTEPLADACHGLIDDIRLLPNTLESAVWSPLQSKRRRGAKLRVGWAGAQQHAADLHFMLDVVKATSEEVDWVFFGMMPNGAGPYVREYHEFTHRFADYPEKLAALDLDLAVAPLEIHPFNEAKSNLRLLEYGILGWPVICSDIFPYRTDAPPVTRLPNTPEKWIAAIRERVGQHEALAREGDTLRAWVTQGYLLENNLERWLKALTR